MDVYIARQPIFTRRKEIYAYELLFRDGVMDAFPEIDGSSATSRVLSSTFFSSDIERITGGKRVFINFNEELIRLRIPQLFPPEATTVEVLESVRPDGALLESCRELSSRGYQIALDDFEYRADMDGLIQMADIIKIDFLVTKAETIQAYVNAFSGKGRRLLAEKVETIEQFEMASEMGFDFFQGYFFSRPELLSGTEIPPLKTNLLEIMSEAGSGTFRIEELERLIQRDVGVSYKLLRYLNSSFFRRRREITSIRHAILMLGERGIRGFLSVIILAELSQDKPDELLKSSVVRAKFCEGLGMLLEERVNPSQLFTMGLFSHIDAILDSPMDQVLTKLPLGGEINTALLNRGGLPGSYLRLAESYERGDWAEVASLCSSMGIDSQGLPGIYHEALGWADALVTASGS